MDFLQELRRRNVFRAGVAYLVLAWLLAQVASLALGAFDAPGWVLRSFIVVLLLGFPLVLFLAWAYELTPQGVVPTRDVPRDQSITHVTGRKLDFIVIGLLSVAVVYFTADKYGGSISTESDAMDKSIAVLPFVNMSNDGDSQPFADGLHDDLLTQLSRINGLRTISRTSMMRYAAGSKSIPEIATELNVATVLEGAVRNAGNRVRINVQLIDGRSDAHLWAETYERELTVENVFLLQAEIASAIARKLEVQFSDADREAASVAPTTDLAAYKYFIAGRQQLDYLTIDSINKAEKYFQQAVESDPGFAEAHAGIAEAILVRSDQTYDNLDSEYIATARPYVERALELKPGLAQVWALKGFIKFKENQLDGALNDLRRAIELDANNPRIRLWYAQALSRAERYEDALSELRIAAEIDPLDAAIFTVMAEQYNMLERFDEMNVALKKAKSLDKGRGAVWISEIFPYLTESCRNDLAIEKSLAWLADDKGNAIPPILIAQSYWLLGDHESAYRWLDYTEARFPDYWGVDLIAAMFAMSEGDMERAAVHMQRVAIQQGKYAASLEGAEAVNELANFELWRDDPSAAYRYYATVYPKLFQQDTPAVDFGNYFYAVGAAYVLRKLGNIDESDRLLNAAEAVVTTPTNRRYARTTRNMNLARIHLIRGEQEKAIGSIRSAMQDGSCFLIDIVNREHLFVNIRNHPDLIMIVEELQARYAAQRKRINVMNFPGPPDIASQRESE